MRRLLNTLTLPALCLALTVLLPACNGGGSSSSSGGTAGSANVDVLLTDTPVNDLLSFRATVSDLRLEIQGGGESANLLAGPVNLDLLALQNSFAWMSSKNLPPDTYTGVRLAFAPGSYDARQNNGTSVAVNALSNGATFIFSTPLSVTASGYKKVVVDLDLASSLSGSVNSPPLVFDPQGTAKDDSATSSHALDEFEGTVTSKNPGANTLVMHASVDDDGAVALGQVLVRVSPTTVLIADNGSAFASSTAFFAALVAGTTHLAVDGNLVGGAVNATRIEVEDNQSGGGEHNLVKLSGLVLGVDAASFHMSIAQVEQGASIVAAANGGTIPASLQVAFDASTMFVGENGSSTTSSALVIGAHVKAKFPTFTNPPFLASRVEIESASVENEGHITSITGLPSTLIVRFDDMSPAVLGGQVATASTDVVVSMGEAAIALDTSGHPAIALAELQPGLEIAVQGNVAGTPTAPTINATGLEIYAGELDHAQVNSINATGNSFTTNGGSIEQAFGIGVGPGPHTILLASDCVFTGDTTTRSGFWALFNGLDTLHSVEVRVKGIATGAVNVIRAYEVRARVVAGHDAHPLPAR